jgi:hypothetical protein
MSGSSSTIRILLINGSLSLSTRVLLALLLLFDVRYCHLTHHYIMVYNHRHQQLFVRITIKPDLTRLLSLINRSLCILYHVRNLPIQTKKVTNTKHSILTKNPSSSPSGVLLFLMVCLFLKSVSRWFAEIYARGYIQRK